MTSKFQLDLYLTILYPSVNFEWNWCIPPKVIDRKPKLWRRRRRRRRRSHDPYVSTMLRRQHNKWREPLLGVGLKPLWCSFLRTYRWPCGWQTDSFHFLKKRVLVTYKGSGWAFWLYFLWTSRMGCTFSWDLTPNSKICSSYPEWWNWVPWRWILPWRVWASKSALLKVDRPRWCRCFWCA